jgi:hypothetical protein
MHHEKMEGVKTTGSRAEVMHGSAAHTSGGLIKKDLKYNKWGRIVSRRMSESAKKDNRLVKHGYTAKKGKFGPVKIKKNKKNKTSKRKTMKKKQ